MSGSSPKILVLAHDLSDAAIEKRVRMLFLGGASVTVAGFRRTADRVISVADCPAVDFGRTYNSGFLQRSLSVLNKIAGIETHRELFARADIIIARNLEMLAIAVCGRNKFNSTAVIIYECLDIHRLLLNRGIPGIMLRALESRLLKNVSALLTSSPAFVKHYFGQRTKLPVKIIENKVLTSTPPVQEYPAAGPPWIIGWFGILRCKKSLHMLSELVHKSGGKVQVVMRGRPALDEVDDFHDVIAMTPGLRFLGPYKNPDDLATIYREVHFTWAIDMYEEGLNSSWLLPNRLYEGGAYGTVPIALENLETGRFLQRHDTGIRLPEPFFPALFSFFEKLSTEQYQALCHSAQRVPQTEWICGPTDCMELVSYLQSLKANGETNRV